MLDKIEGALLMARQGHDVLVVASSSFHVQEIIRQARLRLGSDVAVYGARGAERITVIGKGRVTFTTVGSVIRGSWIGRSFKHLYVSGEAQQRSDLQLNLYQLHRSHLDAQVTYVGGL